MSSSVKSPVGSKVRYCGYEAVIVEVVKENDEFVYVRLGYDNEPGFVIPARLRWEEIPA